MARSIPHLLQETAKRIPENIAVKYRGKRVTYGSLYNEVCRVADYLTRKGLEPGDRAAILIENSPEYISAYYGILSSGGVAVSLNTATRSRDLVNWLEHSGAMWLFADAKHPELQNILAALKDQVRCVLLGVEESDQVSENVSVWQEVISGDLTEPDLSFTEIQDQLATIIYTSGTTGNPKGVMLSHDNLAHNVDSIIEYLKLDQNDSVMNILPFYYSYGNSVLHTHLAVGATLVLENSLLYPHKILEIMQEERVTGFSGVPSTFSILLSRTKIQDYDLSSMRYMTQAGGAMAPASIKQLTDILPEIDFYVMYGQTEATARLSYLPPENLKKKLGSVGKAIPGVTIEIRDKKGNHVEPGTTGQICAKGGNIMMGYWKDSRATSSVIKDSWLMTGDLASCDEDGYIFINGRSSEMIKSGANRISPKEIEEVVIAIEGVEEVAAVGIPDDILGQVIRVVIVLSPGIALEKKKIQSYCRQNLAMYKIPKEVEFVSELPKTASGKIKRFLLVESARMGQA